MFGICFHKYEVENKNIVTYIDEGWEFIYMRCSKCNKLKLRKEIIWRR